MDNNDMKKAKAWAWFVAFVTSWGFAAVGFFGFALTRDWVWAGAFMSWFLIACFIALGAVETKRKDGPK